MNEEILEKLFEYIDARIDEKSESVRNSECGGLAESLRVMEIKDELIKLVGKYTDG